MQIGKVIRKYRKEKKMTQEEMAAILGVTASAVNKWENGNSVPDVMLLAPISRLLDITPDTLLSFREELTAEEIGRLVGELDDRLKKMPYEEAFRWARGKMEEYPNCENLLLNMAAVLDAGCLVRKVPDAEKYEEYISSCYVRALESQEEEVRCRAADILFSFWVRKGDYGKAEEYLAYFSSQNPEKKRKLAQIYTETGRDEKAYPAYEELLFSGYQMIGGYLHGLYRLAVKEGNTEKAVFFADKLAQLAKLFEMGEYNEFIWRLELAAAEKDGDKTVEAMEKLLSSIRTLGAYSGSLLYEHMKFRRVEESFYEETKRMLLEAFRNQETFGWLAENRRWQELVK